MFQEPQVRGGPMTFSRVLAVSIIVLSLISNGCAGSVKSGSATTGRESTPIGSLVGLDPAIIGAAREAAREVGRTRASALRAAKTQGTVSANQVKEQISQEAARQGVQAAERATAIAGNILTIPQRQGIAEMAIQQALREAEERSQ